MALSAGTRLGPYEILAPLGKGGMGEVWKARDTRLGRDVAIKISAEKFTDRFEREARAVAALNHPNICHLYDVGADYLVMELIEGTPLKGPLPVEKAVEYSSQILDALDAAHRKGIVHRDLKPANILVTKQGIKLLDFGLAKQAVQIGEDESTRALTGDGQIIGTLQYMSPEQLQGKEADARSDLFSFGCVLYEMLSGKRTFDGKSSASVIAAILEREPAKLEAVPALDRVVRRSLAKDPDQRFQTAPDLKAALEWAVEQPVGVPAFEANRWWIAAILATLALGALGQWAWAHFHQSSRTEDAAAVLQLSAPEGGAFVMAGGRGGFALSPDGKNVAYVALVNGKKGLWVRPLDEATGRLLPGTEQAGQPFWSPDGKSIGFFGESNNELQRIEVAGGEPVSICSTPPARGGAWTTDGRILFGTAGGGVFQVPASGGTPTPLTVLDSTQGEISHDGPQVLPGGRFLYLVSSNKPGNSGIYEASLSNPNKRVRLVATDADALYAVSADRGTYLLWLRGRTLMAQRFDTRTVRLTGEPHPVADYVAAASAGFNGYMFASASSNGRLLYSSYGRLLRFTWFDRSGKQLGTVGEPAPYNTFRLSPDGRRLVAGRETSAGSDLWLLDLDRGVSSRFTASGGLKWWPVWSPDGRTIVFSGNRNVFRKEINGTGSEDRLSQSRHIQNTNDWSADGRFVLYYEISPETQRDLWLLPVTPDGKRVPGSDPIPYLRTPFNEWHARFSPATTSNGTPQWVAYESDESGRYEVYVNSFPQPHNKVRISTGGGSFPVWGRQFDRSETELFYVSPDYKLMMTNLKLGVESAEPSAPRELFPLPIENTLNNPVELSADGERFLVNATPERQAVQALTIMLNWPAFLEKGKAAP